MPDMASAEELRRILRLIESDAGLRAEVRRAVLTDDLLDLPRRVVELDARLTERMDQLTERLDQLTERLDRLTERMSSFEIALEKLVDMVRRHDVRLGMLSGWRYEASWQEHANAFLGSRGFRKVRRLPTEALGEMLDDAEEAGSLTPAQRDDAILVDAVHRAVRRDDGVQVAVAAEVSVRIHFEDVQRAERRAALLRGALGLDTVACVAGASIDPLAAARAESAGVLVVLPHEWQALEAY
ncbi:MAG: hypothetical protein M0T80_10030 [Actinomycetota bacterium]|nr:hypothetical protein [Actinomycetota bacterium]